MLHELAVISAVVCAVFAAHVDSKPDCRKSGDGYYVKGCSGEFRSCKNGWLYIFNCPRGLCFNPLKSKCDYKADVAICNEGIQLDTRHVDEASPEFNCTFLPDGPYKPRDIECSNTFITCFNGVAYEQACPFGQFYHEADQLCDYKHRVPGCLLTKGVSCPLLQSGHVAIPCDEDEICQKIEPPVDGKYFCSTPFFVWYGQTGSDSSQWTIAPEGLRCGHDGRWYNGNDIVTTDAVDCTAKRTASSSPPDPPQNDNARGAASENYGPTVAPVRDVPIDKFCTGKLDGFYAAPGCQSFFYCCHDEKAHKMDCPVDLFYCGEKKGCYHRENIGECGATPTQPPTTPATDASL